MKIKNIICPYCGAELELEYYPDDASIYLYDCCVCGGTFKHTKEELEELAKEIRRSISLTKVNSKCCPNCGSSEVGLWNSLKQTVHCYDCDTYFNKYGIIRDDIRRRNRSRGGWNGFTDPNDFPTDGFDGGGW